MKSLSLSVSIILISATAALAAPGQFLFQREHTPGPSQPRFSEVGITPENGKVLGWVDGTLASVDAGSGGGSLAWADITGKPAEASELISLAIFGDSISNELLFSNFPGRFGSKTFAHVAAILSGGSIHVRANKGVPGRTTTTLAANFGFDLGLLYPTHALIYCGVNDVSTGVPTATSSTNLLAVVDYCKALRIVPILCTVMPRVAGADAEKSALDALNAEIRYIAQVRGVPLVDLFARTVDFEDGSWLDGFTYDGLHPNEDGALFIANHLLDSLGIRARHHASANFAQSKYDSRNLLTNGLFADDAVPGTPDAWTASGPGVVTLSADENIFGNWCSISQSSIGDTTTLTNAASITGLTAGNTMSFGGRIHTEIDAIGSGGGVTVKVAFAGAATGHETFAPVYIATKNYPSTSAFSFDSSVPAGATSATVSVVMDKVQGFVKVAQLKIANITTSVTPALQAEPEHTIGTRGSSSAIRIHNLTGNVGIGTAPNTSTTAASLKTLRHAQFGSAMSCGTLNVSSAQFASVGTGETNFQSNNLPANMLSAVNDYAQLVVSGSFAANGNAKRVRVYAGASVLFDTGTQNFNGGDWSVTAEIIRTGASTQICTATWVSSNSLLPTSVQVTNPTVNLAANATVKSTGTGTADNDILQKTQILRFYKGL